MSLELGMRAQIRSMVFVAGEPIPFFWPMRSFIHHNPLHGLERMTFEDAVTEGHKLFHGTGYLPRSTYQLYLKQNRIQPDSLSKSVAEFLEQQESIDEIDLHAWLIKLLTETSSPVCESANTVSTADVHALLLGKALSGDEDIDTDDLVKELLDSLQNNCPVYETLDILFDTGIKDELDELVIKSCLDFFDEGQSVWEMPEREKGFFSAWRQLAMSNARFFLRGRQIRELLQVEDDPESVIVHVMEQLKVPKERWMAFFRRELSQLHGWAGFIRWRSSARHYHQGKQFPGDLTDFLAIRLTLALALIRERGRAHIPSDAAALEAYVQQNPAEAYLRQELYGKSVLPSWAHKVEAVLLSGNKNRIQKLYDQYLLAKKASEAKNEFECLRKLAESTNSDVLLRGLDEAKLGQLRGLIKEFERREGMIWLEAMEATATSHLVKEMNITPPEPDGKRPFAQALFCIDTRSERLRRHLEFVGDYQTFGIAGFFGVPVSFMELGKGTEAHMCPVILTPKNLVMEMTVKTVQDPLALSAIEKAVHELKESVLTPFVTVEAIGLLFGFDMFGKTLMPRSYNRWRSRLDHKTHKPNTHLLIDKLSREQADSIIRAVQRAVIANAVALEYEVLEENVNDDLVRELREVAMGNAEFSTILQQQFDLTDEQTNAFVERLRNVYRINKSDARAQMIRLGRIGFSLDEQVGFVSQALHSIGLKENFSRFVLVVGHGSKSENNPYESALDCGACGGNIGIYNARIFAYMANRPAVRQRLREQGVNIPEDAWFVPALHNTTTDEVEMYDLELLPSSHPVYLDRLYNGLTSARRLCAQERIPELEFLDQSPSSFEADKRAMRNSMDWSQVRPEWGLSRNAYFIIGRRHLTESFSLEGRSFLHSYDYRVDGNLRLLENILTGPLVVAQWINMEHYFSTVDNEHYGSGSKVYHNVAGRFGVMTGNISDLRTGLPAQTVLANGMPYHEPMRLIAVIEAPIDHVQAAIDQVSVVRRLLNNGWIRFLIVDPVSGKIHVHSKGKWNEYVKPVNADQVNIEEANVS